MPFYWERHPDGPFVTLIRVATTYLHPEMYDFDDLKALANRDDGEMRAFKSDLRQALRDPARLPGDELFKSVQYDNGGDEAFLVWLWHELYGDEPFDASILTRLKALPEPFAERLQGRASYNVYMVRSAFIPAWQVPVLPASAFLYAAGAECFRHYLRAASFQPPRRTDYDWREHRSLGPSWSCPAELGVRSRRPSGRGPFRAVPASALRS
jgi:hypothetical protein